MTWARSLAGIVTAVAALLIAGTVGLLLLLPFELAATRYFGVSIVLGLPSLMLGWVLLRKESRNLVGPILCLLGLLPLMLAFTDTYTAVVTAQPGLLPVSDLLVTLNQGDWMLLYVPPALLMLYFPNGRLPSRRWRPVVAGLLIVPVLFDVLAGMAAEPFPAPYIDSRHVLGTLDDPVLIVDDHSAVGRSAGIARAERRVNCGAIPE